MSKLEKTCLFIFTLVGVWASIHVGIAADDWPEYVTLQMNLAAILGLWSGDFAPYQALIDFGDRYYGMGFHFFSNALADVVNWFLPDTYPYSPLASKMIFWHASTLLAFVGSGILVRSILMKLTKDALVASLGMASVLRAVPRTLKPWSINLLAMMDPNTPDAPTTRTFFSELVTG